MLPCQGGCPAYTQGCHKDCVSWKDFLSQQERQRREKKEYLRYYRELEMTRLRHLYRITAYWPAR